jgi:cardiolipin synthase
LSDWPSYILASEYLYKKLLKHGVEIYRWEQSILHGKLACFDKDCLTVGSFNLNYTSFHQNLELNININSADIVKWSLEDFEKVIFSGCTKISQLEFTHNSSSLKQFFRFFLYLVLSVIAELSLFFTMRHVSIE